MSQVEKILDDIQSLSPQERESLFERLADFEALRLRKALQAQKALLRDQSEKSPDEFQPQNV